MPLRRKAGEKILLNFKDYYVDIFPANTLNILLR